MAQDEPPLEEALGCLFRLDAFDLEADQPRLGGPGRAERDARQLREEVHEEVCAAPDPPKARLPALVGCLGRRGEAGGEGRAHRRGLEAAGVLPELVVALRVEVGGGRQRVVADVRAVDRQAGPDVEGAHALRA